MEFRQLFDILVHPTGELLVSCQLFLLGQLLDTPALLSPAVLLLLFLPGHVLGPSLVHWVGDAPHSNLAKYWVSSLPCCLLLPQRFSLARQVDHRRPFHWFVHHITANAGWKFHQWTGCIHWQCIGFQIFARK